MINYIKYISFAAAFEQACLTCNKFLLIAAEKTTERIIAIYKNNAAALNNR